MKKLSKKQQQIIIDLIEKHVENIAKTYDNKKHWQVIGSAQYQIKQLTTMLKDGYKEYFTFDEMVELNSVFNIEDL